MRIRGSTNYVTWLGPISSLLTIIKASEWPYLVCMWCSNKDNRTPPRDTECTARVNLTEEKIHKNLLIERKDR